MWPLFYNIIDLSYKLCLNCIVNLKQTNIMSTAVLAPSPNRQAPQQWDAPDIYSPDLMVPISQEHVDAELAQEQLARQPAATSEAAGEKAPTWAERVTSYDTAFLEGRLPSPEQVRDARMFLKDLGDLSDVLLGPDTRSRLQYVTNRGTWFEDPRDVSHIGKILGSAAQIMRSRETADMLEGDAGKVPAPRLPEGVDEDDRLIQAQDIMRGRFGMDQLGMAEVQFTPDNLDNAAGLLWDSLEDPALVRANARDDYTQARANSPSIYTKSGKPIGVARVKLAEAEQAPGPRHDTLLWLLEQGASPRDVESLVYPETFIGGTGGAWASAGLSSKPSEHQKQRVAELKHQLRTVGRYSHKIAKGGSVPSEAELFDSLFGREREITNADVGLVSALRSQLKDGVAPRRDHFGYARNQRESLARWGEGKRGELKNYYDEEALSAPGRVSRLVGTAAVWLATKGGYNKNRQLVEAREPRVFGRAALAVHGTL